MATTGSKRSAGVDSLASSEKRIHVDPEAVEVSLAATATTTNSVAVADTGPADQLSRAQIHANACKSKIHIEREEELDFVKFV
jgi:hypothetical protein